MSYADRFKSKSPFKIGKVVYENETYYLREMSVGQKMRLITEFRLDDDDKDPARFYGYFSQVVLNSLCDENGKLTEDPEDNSLLDLIPSVLMEQLIQEVVKLNNLSAEAQEQLKNG